MTRRDQAPPDPYKTRTPTAKERPKKPAPSLPPKTTLLKIRQASRKRQSGGKGRG
jgi:hypothetical protein